MGTLINKIAFACVVFLIAAIFLTIRQSVQKKKYLIEKEKLQDIIEAKNKQVQELAAQNKVFGDALKESLDGEKEILKSDEEEDESTPEKTRCLNLVLELEKLACEKNNIEFNADMDACAEALPFSETDMVRLFCNVLDNAIEAASGERSAYINFTVNNNVDRIEISVENSKSSLAKPLENDFSTTKERKDIHGRGIGIIKEITEKYHGEISWEDLEDKFITRIIFDKPISAGISN